MQLAFKAGTILSGAIDAGDISIAQAFDRKYRPIPGSNPAQFETSYCKLFDRLLQPLFDGALDFPHCFLYGRRRKRLSSDA